MPELSDDMYCSQQIMVPPMFPYILRQYAKAAIRSQPTDLLRWSTAYFRCLSLNLPPPVKPRLEYPLPKDYDGVTPGWLKALLYQFANNSYVDFKVLWDRWIGACQNHLTLIKILCLGGFTDPMAIPLLRFIGICVGFLSENLTQTMILFCEVVTEEPEGGSAMIPVETFIDVYTFLAAMDASKDQVLLNRYFPDELLALLEKKERQKQEIDFEALKQREKKVETDAKSSASGSAAEEEKVSDSQKDAISCPDLQSDVVDISSEDSLDHGQGSRSTVVDDKDRIAGAKGKREFAEGEAAAEAEEHRRRHHHEAAGEGGEGEGFYTESNLSLAEGVTDTSLLIHSLTKERQEKGSAESDSEPTPDQPRDPTDMDHYQSVDTLNEEAGEGSEISESDQIQIKDDIKASSSIVSTGTAVTSTQSEKKPEDELEDIKFAHASIAGESITEILDLERGEAFPKAPVEELGEYSIAEPQIEEEQELEIEGKFTVEEVYVEAIPGIGAVVPHDLVEVVVEYMKACAQEQQGMVMPRNIRHYSCPPLEAN